MIMMKTDEDDRFGPMVDTATRWAHQTGRRLAIGRRWVEAKAVGQRPLTTLGVAFGLGVLTGWLVKRR